MASQIIDDCWISTMGVESSIQCSPRGPGLINIYNMRPKNTIFLANKWNFEIRASPILTMDRRSWFQPSLFSIRIRFAKRSLIITGNWQKIGQKLDILKYLVMKLKQRLQTQAFCSVPRNFDCYPIDDVKPVDLEEAMWLLAPIDVAPIMSFRKLDPSILRR